MPILSEMQCEAATKCQSATTIKECKSGEKRHPQIINKQNIKLAGPFNRILYKADLYNTEYNETQYEKYKHRHRALFSLY